MYFLGVDLGTSYFKAGLFDEKGNLAGLGRVPLKKNVLGKKSELQVEDFWNTLRKAVQQAVTHAQIDVKDIKAMSYSSQANTLVFLDENLNPVTSFIIWNDESGEITAELKEFASDPSWMQITGIGSSISYGFAISKISWLQKKFPELWSRVRHIKTLADYLTFELTSKSVIDTSTASLTGLLDSKNSCWWIDALKVASVPLTYLPDVVNIGYKVGRLNDKAAFRLGLSEATTFVAGALDHHMAAIGAGIADKNTISESTGTVIAVVKICNEFKPQQGSFFTASHIPGKFFQMAFDENGASVLEWYHKNYASDYSIDALVGLAAEVSADCDGLTALPLACSFEGLKGFENIKPKHHHGHFVRAIMTSTALSLKKIVERVIDDNNVEIISTGGGSKSILWTQIKSATMKIDFYTPHVNESACYGAAILAAASNRLSF